ncbi:speriolin-like protein [Brachyhypopomus gauderio]|uniref:speriolin-like protein n=1 Tax=Brachyhypopomus gauderio TaxID=698409 RepID=UPI004043685F
MDKEENNDSLRIQNEKLRHELHDLKTMLSIVKENLDLRFQLDSFSANGSSMENTGREVKDRWHDSVDESRFRSGLKRPHRTSSPVSLVSDSPSCPPTNGLQNCSVSHQRVKERLVGEIAFQLDRRILSYVFWDQPRLYGFTVLNIGDKIVQVSTHPITGAVEEVYREEMTKRYTELMDQLSSLGYNRTFHPLFTEFIVNMYGILKQRPGPTEASELSYNSPDFLRQVLVETVPPSLLNDLLLLLRCLCHMARKDGRSLFLW